MKRRAFLGGGVAAFFGALLARGSRGPLAEGGVASPSAPALVGEQTIQVPVTFDSASAGGGGGYYSVTVPLTQELIDDDVYNDPYKINEILAEGFVRDMDKKILGDLK